VSDKRGEARDEAYDHSVGAILGIDLNVPIAARGEHAIDALGHFGSRQRRTHPQQLYALQIRGRQRLVRRLIPDFDDLLSFEPGHL
jgi:hypothetical protein